MPVLYLGQIVRIAGRHLDSLIDPVHEAVVDDPPVGGSIRASLQSRNVAISRICSYTLSYLRYSEQAGGLLDAHLFGESLGLAPRTTK